MAVNYAQSWKDTYDKYKADVNFVAGDFDTLKDVIRRYVVMQNPENYNDWAESSEVGMFVNGLSYLGESLHYRVDLNAHDNFPSTTERRQSLLNFAKMLSYSPKRNICANGIAKLTSIQTSQNISDASGNILKDVPILWNDASNPNWLEQFLTIMNASFVYNNPFGKPIKKDLVDNINTQLYQFNTTPISSCVFPFTSIVNAITQQFEVVNPDIDMTLNIINERTPIPEQAFHLLYRNDGTGNSSKNTGFFVYWKQGSLKNQFAKFTDKIENNSLQINDTNINEYDVWFEEIDISSGLVKNIWTKIKKDEYLVYNNTNTSLRNIFKVETRENDSVIIRFSDGNFGTIPVGVFNAWYRVSQGNDNIYIKPSDIKNIPIRIPYKSNNTTDENVYYLTLNFSIEDVSHIKQSVPQESLEYIRTRAPEVYSTQERMVTGSDYNIFPLSFGQQLKVCKSIVRTYAGNSRYINFNDPTGVYQDLTILAEDGYLYKTDRLFITEEAIDETLSAREIIIKDINPLLTSTSLNNFFYNYYPSQEITYVKPGSSIPEKFIWKEMYSEGSNTSIGRFVDNTGLIIPQKSVMLYINSNNLIKVKGKISNSEKWVKVISVTSNDVDDTLYTVKINETLSRDDIWEVIEGYKAFSQSFTSDVYSEIETLIENKTSFGLTYDYNEGKWSVVDGNILSADSEIFDYANPYTDDEKYKNWIIKVQYESSGYWIFKIRYLDYVFGSEGKVSFFFNTDEKFNNMNFYTRDYIKVLKLNSKEIDDEDILFKQDYFWKPCETIKYSDGYIDTREVKVYGYDSDKDTSVDNPIQFQEMVSDTNEMLFFMRSDNDYDSFNGSVLRIPSLWEHTTISNTYYCELSGTVYPKGVKLPEDVVIEKTVRLSNGTTIFASPENPHTFNKGERFDYDVVDDGWVVTWKWLSDIDPSTPTQTDYLVSFEKTPIGKELVSWNATEDKIIRYEESKYYIRYGISKLKFIWKKFASSKYIIDPSTTNIIDIFALTNNYYQEVQYWLNNNKKGLFPKLPSSYELKSMFSELENFNMVSDTIVWHPVKYKLLFGSESDAEYKANFKVIKGITSMSDNEIKQVVIESMDEFFSNMQAGEKFYFTKLSTYIEKKLGPNISTVLIVPTYADEKFGNLFEIACEDDEILLSSATIDNVQIINKITDHNIRIGTN